MPQQQFIKDKEGNKISVVVPIKEYKKLIKAWEELKDIKAYDEAKSKASNPIEAATAFEEIETYNKQKNKR